MSEPPPAEPGRHGGPLSAALAAAVSFHREGKLEEAARLYAAILARNPDVPDALHLSGVLAHQQGRHAEAIALISRAIERAPTLPDFAHSRGVARRAVGDLAGAAADFAAATALNPRYLQAWVDLGLTRLHAHEPDQALAAFQRAAELAPGASEVHGYLGAAQLQRGALDAAIVALDRAVALDPNFVEGHYNLGLAHERRGDAASAEAAWWRSIEINPLYLKPWNNLGVLLHKRRRLAEARACFERALSYDSPAGPGKAELWNNLANVLVDLGLVGDALAGYERAVALAPHDPRFHVGFGGALLESGRPDEAAAQIRMALDIEPRQASAVHNLALVLLAQGDVAAAIAAHRRAIEIAPHESEYGRGLLLTLLYSPAVSAAERFRLHVETGRAMAARAHRQAPPVGRSRDEKRRLRVGWLSSDFRQHPVARNLEPIFTWRDRTRFEFVSYAAWSGPADAATDWFRGHSDAWYQVAGLTDAALAGQIRADGIDVMLYLAGRFDQNRPQVATWRPAPVQVSLHDPATSGLTEMDYLVADPVLVPRPITERFTERVVRLPHFSIQPPIPGAPPVAPPPCQVAGRPTFGNFGNPVKINAEVLALWAVLLRRCPDARLLLRYRQAYANRNVVERIRQGLGDELMARVDVDVGDRPLADHLDLYRRVDVALDTFPFTGSTTTFEALWMGVPVVTLAGETMVARWSASILHALKLDELIARTPDDYVEIALRLAADAARLAELRASLRERVTGSALCDGARFTRHFERLIRALWRRWCRAA